MSEHPTWLVPFAVSAVIAMAVGWGMLPFAGRALETAFPAGIPADRLEAMRNQVLLGQRLGVFFVPVMLLIKSVICAVLLSMLCQIVAGAGTFRQALSLVAHMLPFGVLESLHSLVALKIRGIDSIQNAMSVQIPLGLNVFFTNPPPVLDALLQNINVYQVIAFCYLVIGLRAFLKSRRVIAFSVAGIYWAIGAAVAIGMTVIAHDLQGGS